MGPLPHVGPDGAPAIPPLRVIRDPRPRLCEAGHCRNYHRFEIQLNAEDPLPITVPVAVPAGTPGAQAVPGGTVYQAPATFHTEVHHYCYPTPGVEMALGALPVTQCNRWNPYHDAATQRSEDMEWNRQEFSRSQEGAEFRQRVLDWEAARARELAEAAEAEQLIADSLAGTSDTQGDV